MLQRRTFLFGLLGLAFAPLRRARAAALPAPLLAALESSDYVYVSPLRSDGKESQCHAEVWYGWLDGRVVLITAKDRWKARAVAKGLDRTRIWVGNYGRWKRLGIERDGFRKGPSFEARGERVRDAALLERLMQTFGRKYPKEFGQWESKMRRGFETGDRHMIAYLPEA